MYNNSNINFLKRNKRIKSFVLRYRKINFFSSSGVILDLWVRFGINYKNHFISFKDIFGNNNPIVVDIGFGQGDFFIKKAVLFPKMNFLGIEVYPPSILSSLKYANMYHTDNIKIIHYDAVDVFLNMIPDKTLFMIKIFFPDPWPKRKHHKRRIINPSFISLISKKLIPHGSIHIKTDFQPYANYIKKIFLKFDFFKKIILEKENEQEKLLYQTNYEKRGIKLGNIIFEYIYKI
ncbi:tRNA (guanosine(46)-N7)-methyltransferase TrmB [Buchnera aphidicola]|uniref:tRNA (guanosine(46)-N7)-methyltransferase TrmB n=1 Tax=Buchnera aphidicola TaxID=9 RepID=UPI00094D694A|nr:tRNA (guanosine(46)-N7)-methyltransferase TrmB [Buchnera aphidicola]